MVNVRFVNLSHGKCEFGNYSRFMVNRRVVNLLFGTSELHRDHLKLDFFCFFVACLKVHDMAKNWCQNITEIVTF